MPYRKKVKIALLKMDKDGVIERVSFAVSAGPIVTVGKKDSDEVRVSGDFSVTHNACANVETYSMTNTEDMHSAWRGCTVFSVGGMKKAYHQTPLSNESQKYLTINTHMGLFEFRRLPNGVHSGPAIFQRFMDSLLADIPNVVSRLDDILISGIDYDDQLHTLLQVMARNRGHPADMGCGLIICAFRLIQDGCSFLQ